MELLSKLGIDWKLILAQIVNFALLLGVLTYFVHRPLLNLLDARRERIRKATEDAKRIEEQTKELETFRTEQLKKIDAECGVFLERTKKQAEVLRQEMLAGAKHEVEQMLAKGREELAEERARVMAETQGVLANMIVRLTAKLLEREFSPGDQERLLTALEKQIPTLLR